MNPRRNHSSSHSPIYIQPNNFANCLSNGQDYGLFLDIDGTLADFTLNPRDSVIPHTTRTLLQSLQDCGVNIAAVTGRSLVEARQMLSPLNLPIAATHGLQIALTADADSIISGVKIDSAELNDIKQVLKQACMPYPDLSIEDKPYSVAVHYRQNPELADTAYRIIAKTVTNYDAWLLKQGKCVWEIMPKGADKGTAILSLLANMQNKALVPIFIGDDITDEAGFIAVQGDNSRFMQGDNSRFEGDDKKTQGQLLQSIKGMGIKVGHEPTAAHFYVNDTTEVTVLLASFLAFYQQQATLESNQAYNASGKGMGSII